IMFFEMQACWSHSGVCRDKSERNCKPMAWTYCENRNQKCCEY
nr:Chain A, DEFENSIN-LIKE PEPTIDE-2 [Ornithorhynchus anatinus]1ZUF_A Chain A, Defensin-like peptide 2/4 [synthetic construct]